MKDVRTITPNCFIIYSKDGFMNLCEHLSCVSSDEYIELLRNKQMKKLSRLHSYTLLRTTNTQETDNKETLLSPTERMTEDEMTYPTIISMLDDTFECDSYTFYAAPLDKLINSLTQDKEEKEN